MSRECPVCKCLIFGDIASHTRICCREDAKTKLEERVFQAYDQIADLMVCVKEFGDVYERMDEHTRRHAHVCTMCFGYIVTYKQSPKTCPRCNGEMRNAKEFVDECEFAENQNPA